MNRSVQKINALCAMKFRLILSNPSVMIAPVMSMGYVLIMKSIMAGKFPTQGTKMSFLLNLGLLFNVVMGGIMMSSYPLAEEKERHTLRVLMTSSVTGPEFFIGSLLPPLGILVVTNFLLLPLSGAIWSQVPLFSYFVITTVATVISLILGYIVGILTTNQSQAGIYSVPLLLFLTLVPSFQLFSAPLKKISDFLYSGTVSRLVTQMASAQGFEWRIADMLVLICWLVVGGGVFLYAYRRHGLDAD